MKYYTRKQVAKHNKKTDCWLIANNNVYDVTKFIEKHPIGSGPIIKRQEQIVWLIIIFILNLQKRFGMNIKLVN